jgi:FMN phosphatase YigB (HAD superfamily)/sugar phosphate isomerase/epimerase
MKERIEAVLFDMGGTLRSTTKRLRAVNKEKIHEMIVLLNVDIDEVEFTRLLKKRARAYKDWTGKTLLELNEVDLWRRWMLPDWPSDQVSLLAPQLSQLWRDATGKHVVFPETRETVLVLFRRGYHLGLVSNTTSSIEVPHLLEELGIAGCFEAVILSCVVGIRKPDPSILLIATERMGVRPENCAYIGDQPCRDVAAARKAGFGQTVILRGIHNHPGHPQDAEFIPDHTIDNLKELLVLFPARHKAKGKHLKAEGQVYDASFSTMWANGNFPILGDFFLAAQRFGFSKIELNHQINSGMLSSVDLNNYEISGIHEPCPADISVETLKARDWMISSPDEDCRQQGVAAIKRSIELAGKLSVRTVVVHAGHVSLDMVLEKKLRHLFQALLALAEPDRLGFIYDVGHATVMDRLGFFPNEMWLKRFGGRIFGAHLHDVIGISDHHAPGLGDVDFRTVAGYLPKETFRTIEVMSFTTPEQIKTGLKKLVDTGCVNLI